MASIEVDGLTKTFGGGKRALRDVNLAVNSGEMVALIGASGSGKSTLIRHIAGLIKGDAQGGPCCVYIDKEPMQERGRLSAGATMMRRHVGVIFQQFNLVERLSVLTNVLTGVLGRIPRWRGNLGLFTKAEKLEAMRALARVGISETATRRAATLSGGQKQRAAIARALVQGAKVLLADEPIASLDPASAKRVMETLSEINSRDGITVVVTLHQVVYAQAFCPRTVAMRDGEIVYDGPSEALTQHKLKEIYGSASEELILPDASESDYLSPAGARGARPSPQLLAEGASV